MVFKLTIKPVVFVDAEEALNFYNNKSKTLSERFYKKLIAIYRRH